MIVRKLRLQRGWSQDQLAQMAGVSVRTIQRSERGYRLSLETANALAAVFEVDISTFNYIQERTMREQVHIQEDEEHAIEYARNKKELVESIIFFFGIFILFEYVLRYIFDFHNPHMAGVFLGAAAHGMSQKLSTKEIAPLPLTKFERWLAERKLGRKL